MSTRRRPRSAWRLYPLFVLGVAGILILSMMLSMLLSFGLFRLGLINRNNEGGQVALALLFVVSCLLIALVLTLVFGRRQVRPLDDLVTGMRRVAEGDFDIRLDEHRRGPLHDAYVDFNRMVAELGQTEMLREDFVANVSHEFKGPLATIQGYVTLLADDRTTEEERAVAAEAIMGATRSLSTMSANILTLSRLANDDSELVTEPVELDEQLRHVVAGFVPRWDAVGISFDVDLDPVTVNASEPLLREVWTNLLDNATKYTPAEGKVRVTLGAESGQAMVRVSDTGRGMDEATLRRAFDKFYQGDPSHAAPGNGLGLALCKSIVEAHHGTIFAESIPGSGTTITVTLPTS